jgi:hypothetical protein
MHEIFENRMGNEIITEESSFALMHLKTLKYLTYDLENMRFYPDIFISILIL